MISPVLELVHLVPVNCQPDASTIRRTFQVRAALESRLGREIAMGRDANLAALAEYRLGLGRQLRIGSLCVLTLGTGVGGSIVLNGQLWEGANGMSGEGGHVIVHHDGPKCGCGSSGCLEQYASGTAIARMARERLQTGSAPGLRSLNGQNPAFTGEDVYHLACSGSPDALEIFSRMGVALGIGLASMINTLNVPLYVLGGRPRLCMEVLRPVNVR
jgi:glucokinase